ncbi:MAG: DUF192 domain-containing protein [Candidatus Omnitrophica bacterium]|nr:DUF192 domain-containing protein [Candidatus Omnitrophota bacterium]
MVLTPEDREQGLMFRKEMSSGHGMFFIFDQSDEYPFWMKNMTFPIDILWLDESKVVVHIEETVPPCQADPCSVYSPGVKAKYVLEIPAGDSRKYKLANGQRADIFLSARD